MMVTLAAEAASLGQLTGCMALRLRRRRIGTHFVLMLQASLCIEGLTGGIICGNFFWVKGGLHKGLGYAFLAGKVESAFDQMLRLLRSVAPTGQWCTRRRTVVRSYVPCSALLGYKLATPWMVHTLAAVLGHAA